MAATLGDWIMWLTVILGTPAFIVWVVRGIDVSRVWRRTRIAWLRCYVAWLEWREQHAPVSPQTDQLPDQTDAATALDVSKPSREELLTMYQVLRAHNMSRETARKMLNGVRLPLDNNLWAEAAPKPVAADDAEIVTPYAGRRTKATYYPDDPDLEFRAPPQEVKAV